VVNAWLSLETPKAAMAMLLSGKLSLSPGLFASRVAEADAQADMLRRISFALWVGEYNQYVGALQGLLLERLVAAFKFGQAGDSSTLVRWVVHVQALQCARVLAVRVAPEHLTSLWPVAMAELQRVLLSPDGAQPALLLAACQLVDTLLTALPDDFSAFGWMFVPTPRHLQPKSEFAALLAPLAQLGSAAVFGGSEGSSFNDRSRGRRPSFNGRAFGGLLAIAADGRRRPLLGLRSLSHPSELAPFASHLDEHLARAALTPRGSEVDTELLDRLLGCQFLSTAETHRELASYWRSDPASDLDPYDRVDELGTPLAPCAMQG